MPNYHLSFKIGKDFKPIPEKFKKLQAIDEFTMGNGDFDNGFKNEQELKEYLNSKYVSDGKIDKEDIQEPIVISYKNHGIIKYLPKPFGIAYLDDFPFFEVNYLYNFLQINKFNDDFISNFYNNFKNFIEYLNNLIS